MTDPNPRGARITALIGVYNADGTLRGELGYWLGARLGRAHCALCDITHGSVRERADWKRCRTSLPVPFATYHRDDQPDEVRDAAGDHAPVIVADTDRGLILLLGPDDIDVCHRSPERLVDTLTAAAQQRGLDWP